MCLRSLYVLSVAWVPCVWSSPSNCSRAPASTENDVPKMAYKFIESNVKKKLAELDESRQQCMTVQRRKIVDAVRSVFIVSLLFGVVSMAIEQVQTCGQTARQSSSPRVTRSHHPPFQISRKAERSSNELHQLVNKTQAQVCAPPTGTCASI